MGQQMDKEAELLISSTKKKEKKKVWPHPEMKERGGRETERETQTLGCTVKRLRRWKSGIREGDPTLVFIFLPQSYLLLPPTEQPTRGLEANPCLVTWSNKFFIATREKKYF